MISWKLPYYDYWKSFLEQFPASVYMQRVFRIVFIKWLQLITQLHNLETWKMNFQYWSVWNEDILPRPTKMTDQSCFHQFLPKSLGWNSKLFLLAPYPFLLYSAWLQNNCWHIFCSDIVYANFSNRVVKSNAFSHTQ